MAAKHFTELIAWQLADSLRQEIVSLCSKAPCNRDFTFCRQLRDAADSACANTAEGFGRFRPKEFERFLGYAKGSLEEVQDGLVSARRTAYIAESEFGTLWQLSMRAVAANAKLQAYLRTDGQFGPITARSPDKTSNKHEPFLEP